MGYVTDYIKKNWGTKTRSIINPLGSIIAGNTETKVLGGNPDRFSYIFFNLGSNDLYVSFSHGVSDKNGMLIMANGGNLSMNADDDGELVTYPLYAVAPAGDTQVFSIITEGE